MKEYLSKSGFPDKAELFDKYEKMLVERNEKFNLTSIKDHEGIRQKHFMDSLVAADYIPPDASVLDIGSGAGFPAIPLKIVRDDITVTAIDSVNKKVGFINDVIVALDLKNITAMHVRAEDMNKAFKYDVVVSRAVAALNTLAEYALPFVKIGGLFIAYKSEKTAEEVAAAKNALDVLGGKLERIADISNPDYKRTLVIIRKIKETPLKYPRGKNLPRVKPL